jgi:hypothetical protein
MSRCTSETMRSAMPLTIVVLSECRDRPHGDDADDRERDREQHVRAFLEKDEFGHRIEQPGERAIQRGRRDHAQGGDRERHTSDALDSCE